VASQSPAGEENKREYQNAWSSLRKLILEDGASLSGRERNLAYLNLGDGTFADVSEISAANAIGDARALAVTDWDDDGRVDLILRNRTAPRLQIFRNQSAGDAHFLTIALRGTSCNRDAIGARVVVEAGGRTIRRTLHCGDGFLAISSKRLFFGLGQAERVERLTVHWPDGTQDVYEDLAGDARYGIVQGKGSVQRLRPSTPDLADVEPFLAERSSHEAARLTLMEKLPLGPIGAPDFDDPDRKIADLAGSPLLLNLWSTTCAACLKEFAEFEESAADIEGAGLRLVTLCADAQENPARAEEILKRFGLDAEAGAITPALAEVLQVLFTHLIGSPEELPLPASLLLDPSGQLVAVYFGRVDMDALLSDVEAIKDADPADLSDVRLSDGRLVVERRRPLRRLANEFKRIGRQDLVDYYRQLMRAQ
jgi:thiol-disulfide isomerase/thioredoxin